eukprot:768635-Hanusia_phi.AAC.7
MNSACTCGHVHDSRRKMAKADALHGSMSPLDPLLAALITSNSSQELSKKVNALFQALVPSMLNLMK